MAKTQFRLQDETLEKKVQQTFVSHIITYYY